MKNVVITGAGGVLCGNFARFLANEGYAVALLDINIDAARKIADELTESGKKAIAVKADALSAESLEQARQEVLGSLGKCDILINGAGGNHPKCTTTDEYFSFEAMNNPDKTSFFDLKPENIQFVFNLNFLAAMLTTQSFAKDMLENGGVILNISSMNAYSPLTKIPAYSAAKAAVSNFTQWLAVHFAGQNIRVNAIAPGFFVTNQNKSLLFNEDGAPTKRTEKILSQTPMRRFGKPEELNGTLKWLIDDSQSAFVTGITVPVDGGFSAYSGV